MPLGGRRAGSAIRRGVQPETDVYCVLSAADGQEAFAVLEYLNVFNGDVRCCKEEAYVINAESGFVP